MSHPTEVFMSQMLIQILYKFGFKIELESI